MRSCFDSFYMFLIVSICFLHFWMSSLRIVFKKSGCLDWHCHLQAFHVLHRILLLSKNSTWHGFFSFKEQKIILLKSYTASQILRHDNDPALHLIQFQSPTQMSCSSDLAASHWYMVSSQNPSREDQSEEQLDHAEDWMEVTGVLSLMTHPHLQLHDSSPPAHCLIG